MLQLKKRGMHHSCAYLLLALLAALATLGCKGPKGDDAASCVLSPRESIQACIDALPPDGGTVLLKAGTYTLTSGIHISRSNVTISGEMGTRIKLGDNVNQPVFLVGSDKEEPTEDDRIQNIRLSDMEIDGNRSNQSSETDPARGWIRNNGIDVRRVSNLWIENVTVHDARSGGLVAAWMPIDIFVRSSVFYSNEFDGIALYDGNHITVSDFRCHDNGHSGISLDNGLNNVFFGNGFVDDNADNGIFARHAADLMFENVIVSRNGNFGAFLSHQATGNQTGVTRLFFEGCSFLDNAQYGLALASTATDSPDNTVIGCLFFKNKAGAIQDGTNGALKQAANVLL